MGEFQKLVNIGKTLEIKLIDAGINSSEELIKLGSREAFLRLRLKDRGACFSMLCALEGAIRGVRWHSLDDNTKKELKSFLKTLK